MFTAGVLPKDFGMSRSRVISSRSHTTLIMLTLIVVSIYALMEVVDWVRTQILFKASLKIDESIRQHLFNTASPHDYVAKFLM